jgi:hypothetical protein
MSDSEDPKLRRAMDSRLVAIFDDNEFDVVSSAVAIIEARGSTDQRLRVLEDAIDSYDLGLKEIVPVSNPRTTGPEAGSEQ